MLSRKKAAKREIHSSFKNFRYMAISSIDSWWSERELDFDILESKLVKSTWFNFGLNHYALKLKPK